MATEVKMFRSTSGNVFDTEHQALRDDLRGMLIDSKHANEATATALVEWFCTPASRLDELRDIFKRLTDTHPQKPDKE